MTVYMPVECIGSVCQSCPELDITTTNMWADFGKVIIHDVLTCSHYEKCRQLKEYLETERNAQQQ